MSKTIALATIGVLASMAVPDKGMAQYQRPHGEVLFHGELAAPVGEFRNHVNIGGGGGVVGIIHPNITGLPALRLDGSFVVYGYDSSTAPLSLTVPFIEVETNTTNFIASASVGPQLYLSHKRIRPYVFGTVGASYFATESSVRGLSDEESFASTTNFDTLTFTMTGGGGLSIRLLDRGAPVSLDISATYRRNGRTRYLTKGDLHPEPGGGYSVDPVLSDTNLIAYRIGVTFGVR